MGPFGAEIITATETGEDKRFHILESGKFGMEVGLSSEIFCSLLLCPLVISMHHLLIYDLELAPQL